MDHYSHADRTALPRAISLLLGSCGCHILRLRPRGRVRGPAEWDRCRGRRGIELEDKTAYCAFEPGSRLDLDPHGNVSYSRAVPAGSRWRRVPVTPVSPPALSSVSLGTWEAGCGGVAPEAPLPAGFRVCRLADGPPPSAKFRVAVDGPGGIGARTVSRPIGQLRAGTMQIPRSSFENPLPRYPTDIGKDVLPIIESYEDGMCLEQLYGLGEVDDVYEYRWNSTLDELAGFVSGLNASRPRALRLDTVFVNLGVYMPLFGNDRRTEVCSKGYPFYDGSLLYQNMSVLDGIAFLYHLNAPPDGAWAISSAQAPVFVHGTSSINCTEDSIELSRQCGIVEPPPGAPGCPWGVRFGVARDLDMDNVWPDDGE